MNPIAVPGRVIEVVRQPMDRGVQLGHAAEIDGCFQTRCRLLALNSIAGIELSSQPNSILFYLA